MADAETSKITPCTFRVAWSGACGEPSSNGRCAKHEHLLCVSCRGPAERTCDYTGMSPFVCGATLCADCKHEPFIRGEVDFPKRHVRREEYDGMIERANAASKVWG